MFITDYRTYRKAILKDVLFTVEHKNWSQLYDLIFAHEKCDNHACFRIHDDGFREFWVMNSDGKFIVGQNIEEREW